ncbi:MAG TPA: peptidylprolyl isomerase [Sphingomonas sp.]|jgi:peptidylprolyl isomerase
MISALLVPLLAQAAAAQSSGRTQPDARAPSEIVAAAPASEWVAIRPDDLLVMELAPDAAGRPRRVTIQLMPPPFAQGWVDNIRTLAKAHWWDGLSVNRVQDNYVAQWGDASEKKPLPAGLLTLTERDYTALVPEEAYGDIGHQRIARENLRAGSKTDVEPPRSRRDNYAWAVWHWRGWPLGVDLIQVNDATRSAAWPVHCYGMVGVGRNLSPDTGTGAELYAVIGHAPRHLDRNIALVGRVVEGIEHLSSLPRGTEALGFYETEAERTPIRSVRLASDLPQAERPRFEYLSTEGPSFAAYADARANRQDAFFIRPAGGADICNVPVPVRRAK